MTSDDTKTFKWSPLGGLGEVGMNCMVFYFGKTVIPVDAGILFADPNDFGIEAVYPDFAAFIREQKPSTWLITHAHEDHIGAVPALLALYDALDVEAPTIYASPFAAALIREKLLDQGRSMGTQDKVDCIRPVGTNSEIQLDDLKIRFIETRHSTPDTCSLAFHWKPAGGAELKVVHTADFKLDDKPFEDGIKRVDIYDVFGGARPDFLFIDSTNSERDGHSVSEREILPGLETLIAGEQGRVFVTLFSSNVYRIAALMRIAQKCGREVCLAGRSLQAACRIAEEIGLFGSSCPDLSAVHVLPAQDIHQRPRNKQLVICSGSQGENRSVLMRLSQGQHPEFILEPGDAVIFSSKLIPGNERSVSRLINGLLKQGARVLWGELAKSEAGGPIHASGHARGGEIRKVMEFLRPKNVVPVHGEYRQLRACADIALSAGVAWDLNSSQVYLCEDGTQLSFEANSDQEWSLVDRSVAEFTGRMLRFEGFVAHSRDPFLRVRKRAASGGVVSALLDSAGRARVEMRGLWPEASAGGDDGHAPDPRVENVERWIASNYEALRKRRAFDHIDSELENEMAEELARYVRRLTGLRPYVIFHLVGL
jgi:ribonuclease J